MELEIVAMPQLPKHEDDRRFVEGLSAGDRVAVGQALVAIIYLNGDEHIILDAQHVLGVIKSETANASSIIQ